MVKYIAIQVVGLGEKLYCNIVFLVKNCIAGEGLNGWFCVAIQKNCIVTRGCWKCVAIQFLYYSQQ